MGQWTEEKLLYIQAFLNRVQALFPTNQCTFKSSEKNKQFDHKYNLRHADKVEILKSITPDDCVKIQPNDNPRYPKAEVFVFCKDVDLNTYGEDELVTLYIKEYLIEQNNMEMVVVISFHEEGLYEP